MLIISFRPERHFNPRPRKEGDRSRFVVSEFGMPFQSTPSQRGRPATEIADMMIAGISIHALAKRATRIEKRLIEMQKNFNPRPRKEGDHSDRLGHNVLLEFQSTPSQRGRQLPVTVVHRNAKFQSTPSQRGRLGTEIGISKNLIFQSTPSQRGRLCGEF